MFTLNRIQILFIGIGIICFYLILNRYELILGCKITTGKVIGNTSIGSHGSYMQPTIQFIANDSLEVTFLGVRNDELNIGSEIPVIYPSQNPSNAYAYTFKGFWVVPIIYTLFPLIVFVSAILSFIGPYDTVTFNISKAFGISRNKKADQRSDGVLKLD